MRLLPTRLKTGSEALWRSTFARPDVSKLDVWVISPGGVGTTFLMEYLSGFMKVNDPYDADGLKHWPRPPGPKILEDAPRMLFITGDPETIVASIDRRGWIGTQSKKLGSVTGTVCSGKQQYQAFRRAVHAQIDAWTKLQSDLLLCVRYDDIWDRAPEIGRHLSLDANDFVAGFPPRQERKSMGSGQKT